MSYLPSYGFRSAYPSYDPVSMDYQAYLRHSDGRLKVEGVGSVQVQPDIAVVVLGVITENKELQAAQEENAQKTTEVIDTLKNIGISSRDIQTQSYQIFPQYDYVEGKQIFRGYRVEHTLKVTIRDMDETGEIIDAAVRSGANVVNNITFTVSDPAKYYQQALSKAIDDAVSKAMMIGRKLDVIVSKVPIRIVEESYQQAPSSDLLLAKAEPTTPIQTGEIRITARIEAIFSYSF
ncbi:MAG: SIMPL domain-containing protein [Bacillota bacterium]